MESLIKVRLQVVGFAYAPGREALCGPDLKVLPGERVALVGANGAGKTTVVQPLLGFMRPDAVRILVYGADLHGLGLADFHGEDLRRNIALVSQYSHLFDASIPSPPRAWMPSLSDRSWPPSTTSWRGSVLLIIHRLVGLEAIAEILARDAGHVLERGDHRTLLAGEHYPKLLGLVG